MKRMNTLKFQQTELHVRVSGIPEDFGKEDLERHFKNVIQDYLKIGGDFPDNKQIFRKNSMFAQRRKVPHNLDAILKQHVSQRRQMPMQLWQDADGV